jgi:hypothetical protein
MSIPTTPGAAPARWLARVARSLGAARARSAPATVLTTPATAGAVTRTA